LSAGRVGEVWPGREVWPVAPWDRIRVSMMGRV